jgi:type I site-specific restriction-modification system R (restriction) subunit
MIADEAHRSQHDFIDGFARCREAAVRKAYVKGTERFTAVATA